VPQKETVVRLSREHSLVVAVVLLLWHSVLALVWLFPKCVPFVERDEDRHIVEQRYDHDSVGMEEE
jgi:hypothetical protein